MPAPVRAPKKTISIANDAIFASNEIQPTAPIVVRPPGSSDTGQFLERFTEVIMFGVALNITISDFLRIVKNLSLIHI